MKKLVMVAVVAAIFAVILGCAKKEDDNASGEDSKAAKSAVCGKMKSSQ